MFFGLLIILIGALLLLKNWGLLEGGFWGIISDDGTKYDPIYMEDEYKKDGLPVRFEVKIREDLAGFHMWGTIVEIVQIEKR